MRCIVSVACSVLGTSSDSGKLTPVLTKVCVDCSMRDEISLPDGDWTASSNTDLVVIDIRSRDNTF